RKLLPRDDDALHFPRPLVDARDARVPQIALDRELAHVAVAPVDLDRRVAHAAGLLARPYLGDRRLARERQPLPLAPRRPPPRRGARGGNGGEKNRERWVLGGGRAELGALVRVSHRRGERGLGDPGRLRGDADAAAVGRGHGDLEPPPPAGEPVLLRNLEV